MQGYVNPRYEARLTVQIADAHNHLHEFEAVIDTGFNGAITLPSKIIHRLGLPWQTRGRAAMANGQVDYFDSYSGWAQWGDEKRPILIESAETIPLVGMRLLRGYRVCIEAERNGLVTLEAIGKSIP